MDNFDVRFCECLLRSCVAKSMLLIIKIIIACVQIGNWHLFNCRLSSLFKSTKRQCQKNTFLILLIPSKMRFYFLFVRSIFFFGEFYFSRSGPANFIPSAPKPKRWSDVYVLFFIFLFLFFGSPVFFQLKWLTLSEEAWWEFWIRFYRKYFGLFQNSFRKWVILTSMKRGWPKL